MAAEGVRLQRSFSYDPDSAAGASEGEETPRRSISQRRSVRSHSIVGSLWNYIYTRRQSSLEVSQQHSGEEEDTDHGGEGSNKQEEAWLQAYYNGVAMVVLLVAGYLCWAVYCVLGPFLHPLLWAVLTGIIVYPFKKTWTQRISQWLDRLENNSIPLSAGLVLSPLFLFNHLSKILETAVVTYWWAIIGSTVATVSLWLLYKLSLPIHLYYCLATIHSFLLKFEEAFTTYAGHFQIMCFLLLSSLLLLLLTRSRTTQRGTFLSSLSILAWFSVALNIAVYVSGSAGLALPAVVGVFLIGGVVSFASSLGGVLGGSGKPSDVTTQVEEELEKRGGSADSTESLLEEVMCSGGAEGESEGKEISDESSESDGVTLEGTEKTRSRVSFGSVVKISGEREEGRMVRLVARTKRSPSPRRDSAHSNEGEESSQSYYVFLGLYSMFLVMVFWTHPFLLVLLLPFALWGALKRIVSVSIRHKAVVRLLPSLRIFQFWVSAQSNVLFPAPLPTLSRMYLSLDRTVLKFAKSSVDSLISCCIIVGLLVMGLSVAVFLVLQIQVELSHYVTMMAAVWERTLESNPQLAEWVGGGGSGGQTIQETFGSFATQGYMYGREWLATQVQSALGDSSEKGSAIEKQVLNLYDQLYQSYVLANSTTTDSGYSSSVADGGDLLNEAKIIVMENLETVISVLKSMWVVLSDNLSLALSLLYSTLGLLLTGGSAVVNTVVFLTTLFYLLCYSTDVYLPVQVVLDVLPSVIQSDTAGQYTATFSRAIRSVFEASFSRLLFYGLYTWLVHTAFGLPVSILPAVLAAIAGALPFVGPYWVALPAVLELWLVEGQTLSAIAVLSLSLLPLFFVDSIIYGEVEGGHPYLTGLAVAGGIYFAGLEGALIGPILLCCLVFIHELFGELFAPNDISSQH